MNEETQRAARSDWTPLEKSKILEAARLIILYLGPERGITTPQMSLINPDGVTVDLVCDHCGVLGRYRFDKHTACYFCWKPVKKPVEMLIPPGEQPYYDDDQP